MAHSAPSISLIIEAHQEADIIQYITSSSVEIYGVMSPHWRRGLRLQPVSTVYWVGQIDGYADSNNSIHPRRPSSHQLWVGEISSVKSPVMSHFFPLTELLSLVSVVHKFKYHTRRLVFFRNRAALAGYVVHKFKYRTRQLVFFLKPGCSHPLHSP